MPSIHPPAHPDSSAPRPANSATRAPAAVRRVPAALSAALGILGLALGTHAGVVLTGEHKTLDGSQGAFTYTVSLDKDKARMETSNSPNTAFIYRADKGVFWMLDGARKTYSEMTRKDLESLAASMDAAMQQMLAQLAQLPPEQRAAMEKMMKENMGGATGGPKPTYRKSGAAKVGAWSCDQYDVAVEGRKKAELCLADPGQLGVTAADFKTLTDMGKTFERFAKDLQFMIPLDSATGQPKGAPVKSVIYEGGKAHAQAVLKDVKKDAIPAGRFEVPAGYAKKAMSASDLGG